MKKKVITNEDVILIVKEFFKIKREEDEIYSHPKFKELLLEQLENFKSAPYEVDNIVDQLKIEAKYVYAIFEAMEEEINILGEAT